MNDARESDPQDLAGQYVIGTLPAAARRELERALPHDAALRAAVAEWEARLLPLTELADPVEPPAQLWPRIAASLAAQNAVRTPAPAQRERKVVEVPQSFSQFEAPQAPAPQ